jgi:hypothetical protein
MNDDRARGWVAIILALVVAGALLGVVGARVMQPLDAPPLPDKVVDGMVGLLGVIAGGLILWLGGRKEGT